MFSSSPNNEKPIKSAYGTSLLRRDIRPIYMPIYIIGVIILYIVLVNFWYIAICVFPIIFIWKSGGLDKKRKWCATLTALIIMIILTSLMYYLNRPPLIRIDDPADNITIYEKTIEIKGAVLPKKAEIEINDQKIETSDGSFSYLFTPSEGKNTVRIMAKTWFKKETLLIINRKLTEEEIVEKEKARAKAEADRKVAEAAKEKIEAAGQEIRVGKTIWKLVGVIDDKGWVLKAGSKVGQIYKMTGLTDSKLIGVILEFVNMTEIADEIFEEFKEGVTNIKFKEGNISTTLIGGNGERFRCLSEDEAYYVLPPDADLRLDDIYREYMGYPDSLLVTLFHLVPVDAYDFKVEVRDETTYSNEKALINIGL